MKRFITLLAVLFIIPWSVHATVSDTEKPLRIYTSGASTEYPIPFDYIDDEDIIVTLFDPDTATEIAQTKDVDYTIVDDTVTYTTAPGSEFYVIIQRDTPYTQEASFRAGQAPPLSRYESAFDKLTYLNQDLNERLERALLIPGSSMLRDLAFPDPAYNVGKGIRFKNDGTGIEGYEVFEDGLTINIAKVSDYASFSAMMAAVGSTQKTIIVDTAVTMTTHGVVPSTMTLDIHRTGCITLGAYNLTFASSDSIKANRNKIFNCSGSGVVSFVQSSTVYPEWWGAVGDGTTDDGLAIVAMFDAVPHGRIIGDLSKTYYSTLASDLTSKSNIIVEDLNIKGDGAADVSDVGEPSILDVLYCTNITVKNCKFTDARGGAALQIYDSDDVRVEKCIIEDFTYAGIQVVGDSNRVWILNNHILDCKSRSQNYGGGYGIQISTNSAADGRLYPNYVWVENNIVEDVPNWDGINAHGGTNIFIRNNKVKNCNFGIEVGITYYNASSVLNDVIIDGNVVTGATSDLGITTYSGGISVVGDFSNSVFCQRIKVINNTVKDCGDYKATPRGGIYCAATNDLEISGNHIEDNKNYGISFADNVSNFNIYGNTVKNNNGTGIYLGYSYIKNGICHGNKIYDDATGTYTQTNGIAVGSPGCLDVYEFNNDITTSSRYGTLDPLFAVSRMAAIPKTASHRVGDFVESQDPYEGGTIGWKCVTRVETLTSASASSGETAIVVDSTTGITKGDYVLIEAADGYYLSRLVDSIAGTTINLAYQLTKDVADNALVIANRWVKSASFLSGSTAIASGHTTSAVTFEKIQPDTGYVVMLSITGHTGSPTYSVPYVDASTMTTAGFTITLPSDPTPGGVTVTWTLQRP